MSGIKWVLTSYVLIKNPGPSETEDEPAPKKKSRRRRRRERRQEVETVLELINTMRYGSDHDSPDRVRPQEKEKATRIEKGGFRVHWARFKKRLGTGSTFSDSLLDGTRESSNSSHSRRHAPSGTRSERTNGDETDENEEVDEIVVDNLLGAATASIASGQNWTGRREGGSGKTHSHGTAESQRTDTSWDSNPVYAFFRWSVWPLVYHFFTMHFVEEKTERNFRRETWWTNKTLGIYSSLFFVVSWILTVALSTRPFTLSDHIFFYGVGCLISIPLPFSIIYDSPYKHPILYQTYVTVCVWAWGCYTTAFMFACDFYGTRTGANHCGQRDFIGLLL